MSIHCTVLDIRRLLECRHLDEGETVLGKILVRHAYPRLQSLLGVRKLLSLIKYVRVGCINGPEEHVHA